MSIIGVTLFAILCVHIITFNMEDKCSNFECKLHEDKCKYIKEHTKSLNCELKQCDVIEDIKKTTLSCSEKQHLFKLSPFADNIINIEPQQLTHNTTTQPVEVIISNSENQEQI
jgi:hypothetical protein